MNKWLKNHAKLGKLKRDINAQNAKKPSQLLTIIFLTTYGLDGVIFCFLFLSKNKKKYCGKLARKNTKNLPKTRIFN